MADEPVLLSSTVAPCSKLFPVTIAETGIDLRMREGYTYRTVGGVDAEVTVKVAPLETVPQVVSRTAMVTVAGLVMSLAGIAAEMTVGEV